MEVSFAPMSDGVGPTVDTDKKAAGSAGRKDVKEQHRVRGWAPATTQQSPLETGRVEFVEADALLVDAGVELAKTSGLGLVESVGAWFPALMASRSYWAGPAVGWIAGCCTAS